MTEEGPSGPHRFSPQTWWKVLKRAGREFREDELTDVAAGLTYYAVLSIFPALIVLISILGLIGDSATRPLTENVEALAPGPAQDIALGAIEQIGRAGGAGIGLLVGLAGALWTASGYVSGFSRASNRIYEVEEGRPFWKLRPLQIAITTLMIALLAVGAIAVVVTGPLAEEVGDVVGAGDAAVTAWDIGKWPVLALLVMTMLSILFWIAPNIRQPGFRWITPGGILAVVLWILASLAFATYVANFGDYNRVYGSIAGVIVFLIWLWITNIAILFGAELNAELERERELAFGVPPGETIALEPREPSD